MTRIIVFIGLAFISLSGFSQSGTKHIYSGGMLFFQPGYTMTSNGHQEIESMSYGLGGILRFYFYEHFTAGIYGGTQKTKYATELSDLSYISLGYGGPFLGVTHEKGKVRLTASFFAGKGTVRNLHVESEYHNLLLLSWFYKEPAFVFSPLLSIDYALTPRLNLTLQTVCLTASYGEDKMLYNPTLQIGVLFGR
jgi:hypothetical protein